MITKHRNHGIIQLAIALAMTVLLVVLVRKNIHHGQRVNDNWIVIFIFLYLSTVTLWMIGSFSIAKAKGYGPDTMGGMFIFLFLLGFCVPIAPFLFPGVVIFGLKDKTRTRHRRGRR